MSTETDKQVKKSDGLSPKGAKIVAALTQVRDALKEGVRIEERFTAPGILSRRRDAFEDSDDRGEYDDEDLRS